MLSRRRGEHSKGRGSRPPAEPPRNGLRRCFDVLHGAPCGPIPPGPRATTGGRLDRRTLSDARRNVSESPEEPSNNPPRESIEKQQEGFIEKIRIRYYSTEESHITPAQADQIIQRDTSCSGVEFSPGSCYGVRYGAREKAGESGGVPPSVAVFRYRIPCFAGWVVGVMTIHKLTAGDGYTYLTRQAAGGDVPRERGQSAAEYYTAKGNPPGVWAGRGAPLLGPDGQHVTEQQMFYLFGLGMHPDAERIAEEHIAAHKDEVRSARGIEVLVRHAYQAAALGRAFPSYEGLEAFDTRVAQRLAVIARETSRAPTVAESKRVKSEEVRRQRAAVAGFAAHEAARDAALELLEQQGIV